MRIYLSLIITAILLSFSTAYFALNLQKEHTASPRQIKKIEKIQKELLQTHAPLIELDLSSMYPTHSYFQLLEPIAGPMTETKHFTKKCGNSFERMSKSNFEKVELWEAFRCRENLTLPDHFFEIAPFIHETGNSYAYLAYSSGNPTFNDISWIKKHLNFFHISELHFLPPEALEETFKILATLESDQLDNLTKGQKTLLTPEFFLIKKEQKMGLLYQVYPRLELEKFLSSKPYYAVIPKPGENCFYLEGSVCWQKGSNNLLQMLRPSSIIIFGTSVLILVLVSMSLYSRIRLQGLEEERKRHALRVLTHELRTPIANLMLQTERVNQQSDLMPPALQEEFLKMEGEVYRLKRLAEKSSSYLNSNNEKGLINFDLKKIPSINDLVAHVLDDYPDHEIAYRPLIPDMSVELDPYWYNMCLKNLIENALNHGVKPIVIEGHLQNQHIRLDVIDQGNFDSKRKSSGLGLGLSIVGKIMTEMNGKLLIAKNPTTISLLIRKSS